MKKLIPLLFLTASLCSCNLFGGNNEKADTSPPITPAAKTAASPQDDYKSLNGISQLKAKEMIDHFKKNVASDGNPIPKSVWFSSKVVSEIIKILNSDTKFDGIRVYFGSEPSGNAHLKITLILVATKSNGVDPIKDCPTVTETLHQDIYLDSATYKGLFSLKDRSGTPFDGIWCPGAGLYHPGNNGTDDATCPSLPHNVRIKDAEQMVSNFQQKHSINTYNEWFDRSIFDAVVAAAPNFSGIRIYLARHSADTDTCVSNRDAFLITSTGTDPNNSTVTPDVYDCKISTEYRKRLNKIHKRSLPPQDNGEICPNHCN